MQDEWLPLLWFAIIGIAIFMYVLLDGFVLGVGLLFPFAPGEDDRDLMMHSVAPIWDGNETWLVLGVGGLLAVFPIAYAIVLPALYLPFIFMLFGLVMRGVSFEFRFKSTRTRAFWNRAFQGGSALAVIAQGVVLGAFVHGFDMDGFVHRGGMFVWLTPFGLLTGAALLAGYALLGATWLILKAPGELETWARRIARPLLIAVLVFMALISLWVPFLSDVIAQRWFSLPNLLYLSPIPLLTGATGLLCWRAIAGQQKLRPFLLAMALFTLGYAGLGISLWPNIVPHTIPYWRAAAPASSQGFLLVGAMFAVPALLAYTAYSYWVFRGKVERNGEY
ncbi:MAG: cytochrome d ubiquinol oxidase subunit II [Burkholderiaceae bacterium]